MDNFMYYAGLNRTVCGVENKRQRASSSTSPTVWSHLRGVEIDLRDRFDFKFRSHR